MIELGGVDRRQRVLVLGAAQPAAEGEILADLEIDVDVAGLRHLGPNALDELLGGDVALGVFL